jgi:hypothetical protein
MMMIGVSACDLPWLVRNVESGGCCCLTHMEWKWGLVGIQPRFNHQPPAQHRESVNVKRQSSKSSTAGGLLRSREQEPPPSSASANNNYRAGRREAPTAGEADTLARARGLFKGTAPLYVWVRVCSTDMGSDRFLPRAEAASAGCEANHGAVDRCRRRGGRSELQKQPAGRRRSAKARSSSSYVLDVCVLSLKRCRLIDRCTCCTQALSSRPFLKRDCEAVCAIIWTIQSAPASFYLDSDLTSPTEQTHITHTTADQAKPPPQASHHAPLPAPRLRPAGPDRGRPSTEPALPSGPCVTQSRDGCACLKEKPGSRSGQSGRLLLLHGGFDHSRDLSTPIPRAHPTHTRIHSFRRRAM